MLINYTAVMVDNFSEWIWKRLSTGLKKEKLGDWYAKVYKTAGSTFTSLKEYDKTESTMFKYIIVD